MKYTEPFKFDLVNILIIIAIIAAFVGICAVTYHYHVMNEGKFVIENGMIRSTEKTAASTQ